jgi:adenylate cyclase
MGDSEAGNSRPNLHGSAPPALTPERWQKIKEIFGSALERKPSERSAFLNDACGHDESLRAEVESLLAEAEGRGATTAWVFKAASPSAASTNPRDETAGLGASQREVSRDLVQDVSQAAAELDGNGPSNAVLTKGSRLGDYEIVAQLESGGMSEVYRARDLRLHRDVAIKVLPPSFSADPERLRRFQHEARMAASLNHPHIVTIYAIEEAAILHFLAMELVDGETLEQVIPENGLSLEKFFDLAIPLTEALAAAHDKGIIHRDIKPRNIMIDKRGNVKVLDFGLAKMTEFAGQTYQDAQTHSLTAVGVVMGTIPYMSPEQVQGQKLDARSDIFSLGAVLYQMATGRRPFHAESSAELISSILRDTPPTITELRSDVPAGMRRIIERWLAKQVDERYPSARDLREALARLRMEVFSGPHTLDLGAALDASIAVLPFTNMSTDPESDFFADGITEEIINALAQIEKLHVVARTSAFSFKGKHVDLRIIGERLNVRNVLTGSVRKSGNRLRITAQLQKVADGYQLWSERYDREMKDVFDIQDEIARAIAGRLKITLEGTRDEPLVKAGTRNLEAYQLYVEGRALLYKRGWKMNRALECFQRATTLDPEYALAWAGLADCYIVLGNYGFLRPEASMPKGTEAARRAVALDPSSAEAHSALAYAYLMDLWDYPGAEREFLRALELNPRYTQCRCWYAVFYLQIAVGRLSEGVEQAKLAMESDPLSAYANGMPGLAYIINAKYAEAMPYLERAVELDPDSFFARWCLHIGLHVNRRFEESISVAETALAMSGRHPWAMATLATTFADTGKPADAQGLYAELIARAQRSYIQPAQLAIAAAAAGSRESALTHAREAWTIRDPSRNQLSPMFYWPFTARLHADPRFREIVREMGFH